MSYRYTSYTSQISAEKEIGMQIAISSALDDIKATAEPMTPKKTGKLRSSATKKLQEGLIQWMADYSVYQENIQYGRYTTPGTGPHFGQKAVNIVMARFNQHLRKAGVIK